MPTPAGATGMGVFVLALGRIALTVVALLALPRGSGSLAPPQAAEASLSS